MKQLHSIFTTVHTISIIFTLCFTDVDGENLSKMVKNFKGRATMAAASAIVTSKKENPKAPQSSKGLVNAGKGLIYQ